MAENPVKYNTDNLLQGRDNEGGDMPPYSVNNASFKTFINPSNRGFWDLKETGLFYSTITAKMNKNHLLFDSKNTPSYMGKLFNLKPRNEVLGMTKEQLHQIEYNISDDVKKRLEQIIFKNI